MIYSPISPPPRIGLRPLETLLPTHFPDCNHCRRLSSLDLTSKQARPGQYAAWRVMGTRRRECFCNSGAGVVFSAQRFRPRPLPQHSVRGAMCLAHVCARRAADPLLSAGPTAPGNGEAGGLSASRYAGRTAGKPPCCP